MGDPEPPPKYVEYPRPHIAIRSQVYDTDLATSWAICLSGILFSPIVGIFAMLPVNRAIRKGHPRAKLSRTFQIAILITSVYPWLMFALSGIGTVLHPFNAADK